MGRQKVDNKKYISKFSSRLDELSVAYINKKDEYRKEQNNIINNRNKENRKKWKALSRPIEIFRPEDTLPKYSINQFCEEVSTIYNVNFPYKNYNLYCKGEAFPDDVSVISALAKTFGVSFEYLYGLSDKENEVTEAVEKIIPLSGDAINTLRCLNGNSYAITVLNAILSNTDDCVEEFFNIYEQQYQIYKMKALKSNSGNYDYKIMQEKLIYSELFANFIENHLLPLAESDFNNRLNNDLEVDAYRSQHYDEYEASMIQSITDSYSEEPPTPSIKIISITNNEEDGQ